MFPVMVSAGHSTAGGIVCHFAASTVGAADSGCAEGTNHDSTDWVVPDTPIGSFAKDLCMDEYCS